MLLGVRLGACVVSAALSMACATHRQPTLAERFVHRPPPDKPAGANTVAPGAPPPMASDDAGPVEAMARVRELMAAPRPPRANEPGTLEERNRELSVARLMLAMAATADNHRRVAEEYARLGVLDAAYDHFTAAIALAPNNATAYDGRARIWRNWGFTALALSDVHRAIYHAPSSPVPQNTLGTLLLTLNLLAEARTAFERALTLDPDASYALDNLCHVIMLEGDTTSRASEACRGAVPEPSGRDRW